MFESTVRKRRDVHRSSTRFIAATISSIPKNRTPSPSRSPLVTPPTARTYSRKSGEPGGGERPPPTTEILSAVHLLAEKEGIFTEPAGGTTVAVTLKLIDQGRIDPKDTIVVGITGNGYKALDTFSSRLQLETVLRPRLSVFREWYEQHQPVHAARPST